MFTLQARAGSTHTTEQDIPRIPRAQSGSTLDPIPSTQPSRLTLPLAAPAVEGFGPTIPMPTLMGMGQQMGQDESDATHDQDPFDMSLISIKTISHDMGNLPSSPNATSPTSSGSMPDSISRIFPKIGQATVAGEERRELEYDDQPASSPPTSPPPPQAAAGGTDLTSYQFPVEEDSPRPPPLPTATVGGPNLPRVPAVSAMKRTTSSSSNVNNINVKKQFNKHIILFLFTCAGCIY